MPTDKHEFLWKDRAQCLQNHNHCSCLPFLIVHVVMNLANHVVFQTYASFFSNNVAKSQNAGL